MEGPSLTILKEELQPYLGQKVLKVSGNTKQPKESLKGRRVSSIDTWGKVLFLTFTSPRKNIDPIVTKTHFMMFGSYRINDPKPDRTPRLELKFKNGIVYFYACSLRFDGDEYLSSRDWAIDVMSQSWNQKHVLKLMAQKKRSLLCDLFLDQEVFAGSGNIVKNEVLFNLRQHPLTRLDEIQAKDWPKVAHAVRDYCWNFYEWKKKFELRRHWQVYRQSKCPLCETKITRESLGKFKRRTFYCSRHQVLHRIPKKLVAHHVLPVKTPSTREKRFDH